VGETVTDASQRLLTQNDGLRTMFRIDLSELSKVRAGRCVASFSR